MYSSSRKVLAIVLAIGLCSLIPSILKAQDYDHNNQCCPREKPAPPPVQCCPAPPPPVQCCPTPVLEKPTPCPAVTCCPVDPKEVRKAQKEAEHAAHEAAEACERQQKAAAKAQHEIDEEFAKQQAKIEKANEKVARRNAEWSEANAEYARLTGYTSAPAETVVEITPVEITVQPEEPIRSKPEPQIEPYVQLEKPAVQETPAVAPSTTPEAPRHLPKTASPMGLIGLIGLASMSGYVTRFFRR
jgi:hypothetical protein